MLRTLLATLFAAAAIPASGEQSVVPLHLRCTGNEPSWAIEAGPDNARMTRLAAKKEEEVYRGGLARLAFLDPPWEIWRGASLEDPKRTLVVTMRKEACRDTMADGPPFDYRAVVSFPDGSAATGCCRATFGGVEGRAPAAPPKSRSRAN
jgi:uncharacterized membrane protein